MTTMNACLMMAGICLAGCLDLADDAREPRDPDGEHVAALASRPALSSICKLRCFNSHGSFSCLDHRDVGQVNAAVYPLLENTTKVPSSILKTTTGWASTSCPSCVWDVVSITTDYPDGAPVPSTLVTTNSVGVAKTVAATPEFEWLGTVVIKISDPTDASVGSCTLSAELDLTGGIPR